MIKKIGFIVLNVLISYTVFTLAYTYEVGKPLLSVYAPQIIPYVIGAFYAILLIFLCCMVYQLVITIFKNQREYVLRDIEHIIELVIKRKEKGE